MNQHASGDELDASTIDLTTPPEFLSRAQQMTAEQLQPELEAWLVSWLTTRAGLTPGAMQPTLIFAQLGIDSLTAVEMSRSSTNVGLHSPRW